MVKPLAALILLVAPATASASLAQDLVITGQAGWGAHVVQGDWTPITIDVDNRGRASDVVLSIHWALPGTHQARKDPTPGQLAGRRGASRLLPLSLAERTRKRVSITIPAPPSDGLSLWVAALHPKTSKTVAVGELATRILPPQTRLVAVVGTDRPQGLERPGLQVVLVTPDRLPEDWQGYACLGALIWMDGKVSDLRSPQPLEALATWISTGGRFIVARANDIGIAGTPVAELLPVSLSGGREVESPKALAEVHPQALKGPLPVLGARMIRGSLLLGDADLPLVVDAPRDAGRVTFVAFDPSRTPFAGWAGAMRFWEWLMWLPPAPEEPGTRLIGSPVLTSLASRFPDVRPPALTLVIVLIAVYILLVGPVDYFALRLLKRHELTWITYPACVIGFSALVLGLGGAFLRGAAYQREIAVVDHFSDSEFCRRRALSGVLSHTDESYAFEDAEPVSSQAIIRGYGGDVPLEESTEVSVLHGPRPAVRRWVLQRGATGIVQRDRESTEPPPLSFTFEEGDGRATVTIENTGRETYGDAWLLTPRAVYTVGRIGHGTSRPSATLRGALEAFSAAEGDHLPGEAPRGYEDLPSAGVLDHAARRALIGLCVPTDERVASGLTRGLDVRPWVKAGGAVLLAWPERSLPLADFDPRPERRSSLMLVRFFKGPAK